VDRDLEDGDGRQLRGADAGHGPLRRHLRDPHAQSGHGELFGPQRGGGEHRLPRPQPDPRLEGGGVGRPARGGGEGGRRRAGERGGDLLHRERAGDAVRDPLRRARGADGALPRHRSRRRDGGRHAMRHAVAARNREMLQDPVHHDRPLRPAPGGDPRRLPARGGGRAGAGDRPACHRGVQGTEGGRDPPPDSRRLVDAADGHLRRVARLRPLRRRREGPAEAGHRRDRGRGYPGGGGNGRVPEPEAPGRRDVREDGRGAAPEQRPHRDHGVREPHPCAGRVPDERGHRKVRRAAVEEGADRDRARGGAGGSSPSSPPSTRRTR